MNRTGWLVALRKEKSPVGWRRAQLGATVTFIDDKTRAEMSAHSGAPHVASRALMALPGPRRQGGSEPRLERWARAADGRSSGTSIRLGMPTGWHGEVTTASSCPWQSGSGEQPGGSERQSLPESSAARLLGAFQDQGRSRPPGTTTAWIGARDWKHRAGPRLGTAIEPICRRVISLSREPRRCVGAGWIRLGSSDVETGKAMGRLSRFRRFGASSEPAWERQACKRADGGARGPTKSTPACGEMQPSVSI